MKKQRRFKKEDIGDPSNFVHVQHVGFGSKPSLNSQRSIDVNQENANKSEQRSSSTRQKYNRQDSNAEDFKVERRSKYHRSSATPHHHRSTTMGIFPPDNSSYPQVDHSQKDNSHDAGVGNGSLKPTFGSLLNLSFLPLGLGKSNSKSPSVGKTKRMSLLNLTATNLFASPKASSDEPQEAVHMTGYVRRRSLSKENGDDLATPRISNPNLGSSLVANVNPDNPPPRVSLAKLGRSKSTMAEFTKRPKLLRLKILPPAPPPPVIPVRNPEPVDNLPSPPPSPIPSPPPSPDLPLAKPPLTAPPAEEKPVVRRPPKSPPRPRVIPLPSTSSDVEEPTSPQYFTPGGGSSPQPNDSAFPLSPTLPPTSTPFFPMHRVPGTPPIWPLQPIWPTAIPASIPEVASPCKEEMEISEYSPVLSIVESFISDNGSCLDTGKDERQKRIVSSTNIESISSIFRNNISYIDWIKINLRMFQGSNNQFPGTDRSNEIFSTLIAKTMELWLETAGKDATIDTLADIVKDYSDHASDLLRNISIQDD